MGRGVWAGAVSGQGTMSQRQPHLTRDPTGHDVSGCEQCGRPTRGPNDTLCAACWKRVPWTARQRFVLQWHTAFKYALPPEYLRDMTRIFIATMEAYSVPDPPTRQAKCHPNRPATASGYCDECLEIEMKLEYDRARMLMRIQNRDPSFYVPDPPATTGDPSCAA